MAAIYDTKTVKEIFKTAGFILTDEYVSYNKKMKCICENGHEQEKPLASIKSGEGCYKCYCERPSPKRLTTQEFIEKAIAVHGDRYDYSRVMYTVSSEKVVIVCPEHSIKTKYALDNGIKLIRIPYWDYDNIEEILEDAIYG